MIDEKKLIEDIISNDGIQFDMDFEIKPEHKFIKSLNRYTKLFRDGIINLINKQPKVGEWIPCSERLPEVDDMYLITAKVLDKTEVQYVFYQRSAGFICNGKAIAWMELPEAYTETV